MTAELCATRPAEFWDSLNDGARLAIAICGPCPGRATCLDDEKPAGVIRAGIAFDDFGKPFPLCATCGYPRPGRSDTRCRRCDVPTLGRWKNDMARWHADGVADEQAGSWIGATSKEIRDTRRIRSNSKRRVSVTSPGEVA